MIILGIETSCDETGAAIIDSTDTNHTVKLLSHALSTSIATHAKEGGIIPEYAAREQLTYIIPVIDKVLQSAKVTPHDIDAIAVTYGPGLIGSLLVGVETARTLAYTWNKPLIPVNHLIGHIYANWIHTDITLSPIIFPALALIVSGGHTDLVLLQNHTVIKWLGGTRDDAAGEALDKIGRLLSLPYPGGPSIEQAAKNGVPNMFTFPRPLLHEKNFDFSFSGLKAAVLRTVQSIPHRTSQTVSDIARETQEAVCEVLVKKTLHAGATYNVKSILLSGGVSANEYLTRCFRSSLKKTMPSCLFFSPSKQFSTDNAAMIACAGFYNFSPISWNTLVANPELYF